MSETGTPSKTAIASKATRIEQLLGPGFSTYIRWNGHSIRWYEVTAFKEKADRHVAWTMIEEDFNYTDEELMTKFINPAKGVFK